jgi:hypothetical protein
MAEKVDALLMGKGVDASFRAFAGRAPQIGHLTQYE